MKTAEPKQKHNEWRARIEEWRAGGQSQARYCRENRLSLATFGYWKRRMAEQRTGGKLVRLEPPAAREDRDRKPMVLILPEGLKIVFGDQTSVATVVRIVETLCGSTGAR
jgi:hypothetical protein